MKKILKYILTPLICLVISYLFVAFSRWEIDASKWHSFARFGVAVSFSISIAVVIIKEHE